MKESSAKILSFLIVFTPFLEPYKLFGVTLDTACLFASIIFALVACKGSNAKWYGSKPFFIYAFTIPNIVAILYGYTNHIMSSFIVLTMYLLVLIKVFPNLSFVYIKKYYKVLVILVCVVFITQELMYLMLGYRFSALLPFLDIRYDGLSMASFIQGQMSYPRSSSFFLEPSHMAHFLLPYLALSLGENIRGLSLKKYIEPIIITIILFFLQSGNGLVGAFAIWVFFVLAVDISRTKKVLFIATSVLVGYFVISKLMDTEIGASLFNRVSEIDAEGDYERSGTIRIFRGFYVFSGMDSLLQLLGVGTGGSVDVIDNSKYLVMFFDNERYLNNIQMLLIGFGIIGTILFSGHIVRLYRKNALSGKLVLAAFIAICFLESFFMTSKMILFMTIAFLSKVEYDKKYLNKPSAIK